VTPNVEKEIEEIVDKMIEMELDILRLDYGLKKPKIKNPK